MTLGIGIPPLHGEVDAAYCTTVVQKLRPRWWYDWRYGQIGAAGYVPMIWWLRKTKKNFTQGLDMAAYNGDMLWLLGNEPEMNGVQPHEAAQAMRKWQERFGPVIQHAIPGVNLTLHHIDTALAWLDDYIQLGGPLPDFWHVHIYGPADSFDKALRRFRAWMRSRKTERPVIVSEFATTADGAATLMVTVEEHLCTGTLHMAAWFSAYWQDWNDTGLLDANGNLTEIGEIFLRKRQTAYLPGLMA